MKIKITYTEEESREARLIELYLSKILSPVKKRHSAAHAPFMHIYLQTVDKPRKM